MAPRLSTVTVAALLIAACGGAPPVAPTQDAPVESPQQAPPRIDAVETLHGLTVRDPFRPLEQREAAQAFIDAQNAQTNAWMQAHARAGVRERLDQLFDIGSLGGAAHAGDRVFFTRKEGDQEQAVLYVQVGAGAPRPLIDPNALDAEGRVTLDWYYPTRDGRLLAYGLSKDGDENSTLRVIDVDSGAHRPDEIAFTRACSLAWLPDASGFYYTRYPATEAYDRHVWFHRLGADPAQDERVIGKERLPERTDWPGVLLSPDGRHLLMVRYVGWSESTLHLLDRATGAWTDVAPEKPGLFEPLAVLDGQIWAATKHDAPRGRIVRIDPARPQGWAEVVPQQETPLEASAVSSDAIVTLHLDAAAAKIQRWGRDGKLQGEVPLPVAGTVSDLFARPDDPRVHLSFQSFFVPPSIYRLDGLKPQLTAKVETDLDTSAYVVDQVEYRSYDGTAVPMFVIHRKDLKRDGTNRTLLYGYGGFNVSMTPSFSRNVLFWLEQGGVYAVANLRGGGERGEAWHQAGMFDRKFQVFADFEYAARHLIREGYTRPSRLAILGGSNGGLLVGALVTRAPFLFRAAVGKVGLYDMVRFTKFPPAELWIKEYGSPDDPSQLPYLWAYSPYHQVLEGVEYPAVLLTTADKDTRVHWAHTAKFAAALQAASAGGRPVLMRFETQAGHGAGKRTSAVIEEYAELYQFLLGTLE